MNEIDTAEKIRAFVAEKIQTILLSQSDSTARASLARLRKGIGHAPGEMPELWGEYLMDLPEALTGYKGPSHAEWAIYVSLTMFALHQQGKDRKLSPMHKSDYSLGTSVRHLVKSEDDRERVARRFNLVAAASNMVTLSYYLRGLVTMLRSSDIPLDYVRLAVDLFYFQDPRTADQVRLHWGEDFWRAIRNDEKEEQKGE